MKGKIPLIGGISYGIFFLTILLVPILFLPASLGLQLEFLKKVLFSGGILLSFALWLITRLEGGAVIFPGGGIFWVSLLIPVSFLISSVLSLSPGLSFFGLGHETDTFVSIVLLFLAMFLSSTFFESREKLAHFFWGLIILPVVVWLIQVFQILSPIKLLSGGAVSNTIGRWNDFGIFFGLSLLISLVYLELWSRESVKFKSFFWFLLVISILSVAAVNYNLIWSIVGVFSLFVLIFSLAKRGTFSPRQVVSRPSFVIFIVSVVLFFGTNFVGSVLGKYGVFQLEVRPSWQTTLVVAGEVMKENLYFGSGPNTFSKVWTTAKPDAVNSTVFWRSDFNSGVGRIPSYLITLGLFGIFVWILFFALLIYYGFRALLSSLSDNNNDPYDNFAVALSFIASFYLWTFSTFYVVDTVISVLTFVSTGIFLASLVRLGLLKNYQLSWLDKPRMGFMSVLVVIILAIAMLSLGYLLSKKFLATYNFERGLYVLNVSGNSDLAESSLKKAIAFDEQDLYYRSLSEIYVNRIKNILSGYANLSKETILQNLQVNLTGAAGSARKATELDAGNYLNWLALGGVGEVVIPLKDVVTGSYDLALNSYTKALSLNPKDPSLYLGLARINIARGDISGAREYISQALLRKSNFADALFLLSQIEISQNNLSGAINQAEQAALFSPEDVGILFQLGFLKYTAKDYLAAVSVLERLVSMQPSYSNARYFLGLSYGKLSRNSDAISQFENIANLNPDNQEVKTILKNLRASRGALDSVVQPGRLPINER